MLMGIDNWVTISGGGAVWQQTWADTKNTDFAGIGGYSIRQVIPAADISLTGNPIRITFTGTVANGSIIINNASIVERSTTTANGTTTPTELLFSGVSGVTITQGSTATSDSLSFALDETKDYLVIMDLNVSNGGVRYNNVSGLAYFSPASASYNQQNVTGYLNAAVNYMVSKIEIFA